MSKRRTRSERRAFIGALGSAVAATLGSEVTGRSPAAAQKQQRPNVLIVQPDQHRGTVIRCAGDAQAVTPNLDRLAGDGIRFTNCASASPVCSPFRGSFQTGLYCFRHGVVKNNIRMDPDLATFAEVFEQAGYATGYIGKWHLDGGWPPVEGGENVSRKAVGGFVPPERRQGWQEWRGYEKAHEYFEVWKYDGAVRKVRVEGYDWEPRWHTDVALDFARRHRDAGRPWLYYIAFGPPHVPEQCPREFLDMYDPQAFVFPPDVADQLPDERKPELRQKMQMYYAQVTAIDHEVGRLLRGLGELGVAEDTIVLYTSDHGDYLGSHAGATRRLRGKGSPHATAFRIPLIVRWPNVIAPGQVSDELVSSVDLAPTVLDLAGLPVPPVMQGHSKAAWLLRGRGHHSDAVYLGLGDNKPTPPEAIQPRRGDTRASRMNLVVERPLPAGPGIGTNPTLRQPSGNWDCGYDERITIDVPRGKHTVLIEHVGRGRLEVEYTLHRYVEGKPEFQLPTSDKYVFDTSPENEFAVTSDGIVGNAESLRPHLYASAPRHNPPVFVLDCAEPAQLQIHVTKSVGDASNKLRVYLDEKAAATAAPRSRIGNWWRAVWDGRYVYRPGGNGWLYDHQNDPHEMTNLVDSAAHGDVRRRLARMIIQFADEYDDPVLPELGDMLAGS